MKLIVELAMRRGISGAWLLAQLSLLGANFANFSGSLAREAA
jgi:hypothetical protein